MGKKKKHKKRPQQETPVLEVPRYAADGQFLGHELATRKADGSVRPLDENEIDALRYRTARRVF
jgi:hypothetical protein